MDATTVTLIGVIVTGAVSAAAIGANVFVSRRSLEHAAARDVAHISLEFKLRQLNELYGPLYLLIEQDRRLARRLRQGKEDAEQWRLLDHISEVRALESDAMVAEEIMRIDAQIKTLIIEKAGLVVGSVPPASFEHFLGHYDVLRMAWEGESRLDIEEYEYYPRQLNEDVASAYRSLKLEIADLQRRSEAKLG